MKTRLQIVYSAPMLNRFRSGRYATLVLAAIVSLGASLISTPLADQWVKYPTAGAPRKADGSVDMSAATPRMADGKPDFSGTWTSDEVDPRRPGVPPNPNDATTSRRMVNLGVDVPGGLLKERLIVDVELIDEICLENERDIQHIK